MVGKWGNGIGILEKRLGRNGWAREGILKRKENGRGIEKLGN
jgi:hypothetical protein